MPTTNGRKDQGRIKSAIFLLALVAIVGLAAAAAAQDDAMPPKEPDYSLEANPDDTPGLAKLKAALRLLSAYTQVQEICQKCSQPQILKGYAQANGSTLPLIVKAIQLGGGQDDKWKAAVNESTRQAVQKAMAESDCAKLVSLVRDGHWSLYSGRFAEDYKLVKGK
ncbi:MAG: hypothetical protein LBL95_08290 [Deltaproteobacteria bacterium]|nr:hypothetical protein [Deltaproteobacteria bacterium]